MFWFSGLLRGYMMGPSPWIKTQAAGCGLGNRGPWIETLCQTLRPRREPFKRGAVVLDRVSLPLNGWRPASRGLQKGTHWHQRGGGHITKKKLAILFSLPHVTLVPLFPIYRESFHDCHWRWEKSTYKYTSQWGSRLLFGVASGLSCGPCLLFGGGLKCPLPKHVLAGLALESRVLFDDFQFR